MLGVGDSSSSGARVLGGRETRLGGTVLRVLGAVLPVLPTSGPPRTDGGHKDEPLGAAGGVAGGGGTRGGGSWVSQRWGRRPGSALLLPVLEAEPPEPPRPRVSPAGSGTQSGLGLKREGQFRY